MRVGVSGECRPQLACGFSDGFFVVSVFGGLLGDFVEAGFGGELGFVVYELGASGVDVFEGLGELLELRGVHDFDDLVEGEGVILAEVEGGDGGVEKVSDEGVGELWGLRAAG